MMGLRKIVCGLLVGLLLLLPIGNVEAVFEDYYPGEVIVQFYDDSFIKNEIYTTDRGTPHLIPRPPNTQVMGVSTTNAEEVIEDYNVSHGLLGTIQSQYGLQSISTVVPVANSIESANEAEDTALSRIYKLRFANDDARRISNELLHDANVAFAEPNWRIRLMNTPPNDALFVEQWYLENTGQESQIFSGSADGEPGADINLLPAWDIHNEADSVVICMIDDGFFEQTPEIADAVWKNPGEIPGNQIDDDHNGYVDDTTGWDFVLNTDASLGGGHGHAQASALIIASKPNNQVWLSGMTLSVQLMDINIFGLYGGGIDDLVAGLKYGADMGCDVANLSLGTEFNARSLRSALQYLQDKGVLAVAAAGNYESGGLDLDHRPVYPGSYPLDNIITVGSFNKQLQHSYFSNYSPRVVDILAPGEHLVTHYLERPVRVSGTSFATPQVSATAALLWDMHPEWDYRQIKQAILEGARREASFVQYAAEGRMLDVAGALELSTATLEEPPTPGPDNQQQDENLTPDPPTATEDPEPTNTPLPTATPFPTQYDYDGDDLITANDAKHILVRWGAADESIMPDYDVHDDEVINVYDVLELWRWVE